MPIYSPSAVHNRSPGCGSQRLFRYRSYPAGRSPNSSSLFPPLAAVVAVAPGRGASGEEARLSGMPRPPLDRSNGDDRRQRRKQGGAVGAAASKAQAKRSGCWVPQPGQWHRVSDDGEVGSGGGLRAGCPSSNLSVCFADSSPSRGASGEEIKLYGMPKPPLGRGGGIAQR